MVFEAVQWYRRNVTFSMGESWKFWPLWLRQMATAVGKYTHFLAVSMFHGFELSPQHKLKNHHQKETKTNRCSYLLKKDRSHSHVFWYTWLQALIFKSIFSSKIILGLRGHTMPVHDYGHGSPYMHRNTVPTKTIYWRQSLFHPCNWHFRLMCIFVFKKVIVNRNIFNSPIAFSKYFSTYFLSKPNSSTIAVIAIPGSVFSICVRTRFGSNWPCNYTTTKWDDIFVIL